MACAAPVPVAVNPALQCEDPAGYFPHWVQRFLERNQPLGSIIKTEIAGEQLAAVLKHYNDYPPKSVPPVTADTGYFFARPGIPNAVLVFVENNCVVVSGQIGIPTLTDWLTNASGHLPILKPGMRQA